MARRTAKSPVVDRDELARAHGRTAAIVLPDTSGLIGLGGAVETFDLRLGPLLFPAPIEKFSEGLGDGLDAIGATLVAAERRPRPVKLQVPIRGASLDSDPKPEALRLRRQLRQMMNNGQLRLQGFFLLWSVDEEADCWLKVGTGELSESDPGITFGEYELSLGEVFVVARPGTHRPGRRMIVGDRRTGLVARDTLRTLFSVDFATQALPERIAYLPGDVVDFLWSGAGTSSGIKNGPSVAGRLLWQEVAATDGEVYSYDPYDGVLPDRDKYLALDEAGAVRTWAVDPATVAGLTFTEEGDLAPDEHYEWERVYGALLTPRIPIAIDNGACRVIWLSEAQGLAVEFWSATAGQYVRAGRVAAILGRQTFTIVELTMERVVVEIRQGRIAMRVILQRGWRGPRLEAYDADATPKAALEYTPEGALAEPGATEKAEAPTWVRKLGTSHGTDPEVMWAQGSADETRSGATFMRSRGGALLGFRFAREARVIVAQIQTTANGTALSAGTIAGLSLLDVQPVPVLEGR